MASRHSKAMAPTVGMLGSEECLSVLNHLIDFNKTVVTLLEKHGRSGKRCDDLREFTVIAERLALYVKSRESK